MPEFELTILAYMVCVCVCGVILRTKVTREILEYSPYYHEICFSIRPLLGPFEARLAKSTVGILGLPSLFLPIHCDV